MKYRAMRLELEKLAKRVKNPKRDKQHREGAAAVIGSRAVRPAAELLAQTALRDAAKSSDPELSKKMVQRAGYPLHGSARGSVFDAHASPGSMIPKWLKKAVKGNRKLSNRLREGVHLRGRAAYSPAVAAHELGHMDIARSRAGRLLQNFPTTMAMKGSPLIGFGAGLVGGATADVDDPGAALRAAAVPAVAAVPGVGYETLAHLKGIKHLRGAGMSRGQAWKSVGSLAPRVLSTYVAMPAAGAGMAFGGTRIGQASRGRKKDKEQEQVDDS